MASIRSLELGQILYEVARQKMGNTSIVRGVLYTVKIVDIDPEGKWVLASWNSNTPRRYNERQVRRWKIKKPAPKRTFVAGSLPRRWKR